jgi:hypothetical protein
MTRALASYNFLNKKARGKAVKLGLNKTLSIVKKAVFW